METQGAGLHVAGISKSFGDVNVLKQLDLSVQKGEFLSIVGRSGCGKSTFLRLLAGLDKPTTGEIELEQQIIRGINPQVRVMFQDSRLLPWLTVIENVELGLDKVDEAKGKTEMRKQAADMLEQVGLKGRENEWPHVLSGGQKQRVSLARALISKPKLLLLDEPLGALDAFTRLEMHQLILNLWEEHKFTAFLVTHDVAEAISLADRVLLLEEGNIAMDLNVAIKRPRERDNHEVTELEKKVIHRVMNIK
ncbi:ABC transporter ATP-binding protein [Lederbergia lenta]|uniref:ABC transporter-like protein n=1 Tax=Lederbergia lenta TaxID=1467 RepID=A0A2X4X0I5_LEDLE|nr:ABC transporter ATP-binding protein [Lederbergia lenta]MCM3112934.1 ABC transporter ATP-binding protein [Lederbergia lenta]MEC2326099.1 ABC transporter ATP-binding protein [Lederbergia lenta]SQI63460.1 ABC transporter-like protein [Lederbergia lenta]